MSLSLNEITAWQAILRVVFVKSSRLDCINRSVLLPDNFLRVGFQPILQDAGVDLSEVGVVL
ncbi:MAG: hypothetical protein ACI9HK_001530, partial [Pirellulaceae bacterium]